MKYDILMGMTLHYLCQILLLRSELQVPPTFTIKRELYKGMIQKAGVTEITLKSVHHT